MRHAIRETNNLSLVADYIGPFTDGTALKTTLKLLRRIFPYCTCTQQHHIRCLNAHIGKCLGFCCLKQQNPELRIKNNELREYRGNIRAIKGLLSGKRVSVIRDLEKEMKKLASAGELEKAIALQQKIERAKRVFENARIVNAQKERVLPLKQLAQALKLTNIPMRIEGYDISNISGQYATGSMVVFNRGKSDKDAYRKFKIRQNFSSKNLGGQVRGGNDVAMLKEVLTRRLNHPEWPYPDLIIIDGGKGQLNVASAALSKLKVKSARPRQAEGEAGEKVKVIALTKNEKHIGDHVTFLRNKKFANMPLAKFPPAGRNLILSVDAEAHRFAISYYRKLHAKTLNHYRTSNDRATSLRDV